MHFRSSGSTTIWQYCRFKFVLCKQRAAQQSAGSQRPSKSFENQRKHEAKLNQNKQQQNFHRAPQRENGRITSTKCHFINFLISIFWTWESSNHQTEELEMFQILSVIVFYYTKHSEIDKTRAIIHAFIVIF